MNDSPKGPLCFPNMDISSFQHPADIKALEALKKMKGLDWLTKKVMELGLERIIKMQLISDSLKVSDKQCASLSKTFKECCNVLDIVNIPEFFVECNPFPNAYTTGFTSPVVVVTSGLLEIANEDELRFILGHELGHFKCGHVLYMTMAQYLALIMQIVGDMTLGVGRFLGKGLELAFLLWSRKAEFSADRGGLLACQKDEAAIKGLMKLAAPIDKIWKEISVESILAQAETFEDLSEDKLSQIYKFFYGIQRTHPWLVLRTKEIKTWQTSDAYKNIIKTGIPIKEYLKIRKPIEPSEIPPPPPPLQEGPPREPACPACGKPLTYIQQYNRWYCYSCKRYV